MSRRLLQEICCALIAWTALLAVGVVRCAAQTPPPMPDSAAADPLSQVNPEDLRFPVPQGWRNDFPFIDFSHRSPNDPERHVGMGEPLEGTSWLNRPWHVGWFVGAMNGDALIDSQVDQRTGLFGGYRLGYDFDHYWGTEFRFAFANLETTNNGPDYGLTSRDWFFDLHLLHYPWGDAQWRPYFSLGLGWADFYFPDANGNKIKDTTVHLPIGVGVKYFFRPWMALRTDLMGNIAFGSEQIDAMFNLSWTVGTEIHFGGRRKSYFPWHTGIHPW